MMLIGSLAFEEIGDRLAPDPVALVLEAMDLDPVLVEALEAAQVAQRLVDLLALLDDERASSTAAALGASIL